MRIILSIALCAMVALPGCAGRTPVAEETALPAPATIAIDTSNRFDMTQDGRVMSAGDFDAWMKARGIRIAKGPQAAKPQPEPPPIESQ